MFKPKARRGLPKNWSGTEYGCAIEVVSPNRQLNDEEQENAIKQLHDNFLDASIDIPALFKYGRQWELITSIPEIRFIEPEHKKVYAHKLAWYVNVP